MSRDDPTRPVILAEFGSAEALIAAATRLRELGYRRLETYSPYPLDGAEAALSLPRPRLPWVVLAGGLLGAALGYAVQSYTNARDYPLNVGGRPLDSVPAWIPITFEIGILAAAITAVLALLVTARLPRLWHPVFEVDGFESVTDDRFWLAVLAGDPRYDPERTRRELEALAPLRIARPEATT